MFSFLQKAGRPLSTRRMRKLRKQLMHASKVAYRYRRDVAPPAELERLKTCQASLETAWQKRDPAAFEKAGEALDNQIGVIKPPPKNPEMSEWVEVVVVAVAVAMGFRAYFLQPYKIPTGSMQETLWGITYHDNNKQPPPHWLSQKPFRNIYQIITGSRPMLVTARRTGQAEVLESKSANGQPVLAVEIAGEVHRLPGPMMLRVAPDGSTYVQKGDVIAYGLSKGGDHILVNRMAYNFRRPNRGDIAVFSTRDLPVGNGSFYIKRMVGLPGDRLSIDADGQLNEGGEPITDPPFFAEQRYGHVQPLWQFGATYLSSPSISRNLSEREYVMMGDNTSNSLDGRYFGPIDRERLVGPYLMTYWPFFRSRDPKWVGEMIDYAKDDSQFIK